VRDVLDRLGKVVADGARGPFGVAGFACGQDLAVLAVEPLGWDAFRGVDLEICVGGVTKLGDELDEAVPLGEPVKDIAAPATA
jgi:hypothetical protein